MSVTEYFIGLGITSGISFACYSVTDLSCQVIERQCPILKIQRTVYFDGSTVQSGPAPTAPPEGLGLEDESDPEDWQAIADDKDGLLTPEGWPKGRCCEGLERAFRRGCRKVAVKLKLDWIDWASMLKYNVIPLVFYNPVGYSWYYLLEYYMPGSYVFGGGALWEFFAKWGTSVASWLIVYKVVRKLEFYRNADFHDRCRDLRRKRKRVRFLEIALMATTQACIFLFVDWPVWQRSVYLAFETLDTFLLYYFLHGFLTARAEAEVASADDPVDDRPPYTIIKGGESDDEAASKPSSPRNREAPSSTGPP